MVIGNRTGFGKERFEPHNILVTFMGMSMLWVGWFGFNAGTFVCNFGDFFYFVISPSFFVPVSFLRSPLPPSILLSFSRFHSSNHYLTLSPSSPLPSLLRAPSSHFRLSLRSKPKRSLCSPRHTDQYVSVVSHMDAYRMGRAQTAIHPRHDQRRHRWSCVYHACSRIRRHDWGILHRFLRRSPLLCWLSAQALPR